MKISIQVITVLMILAGACGKDRKAPPKEPAKKSPVATPMQVKKAVTPAVDHTTLWTELKAGKEGAAASMASLKKDLFSQPWEKGMTLLHAAARSGKLPLVKAANSAAALNLKDDEGWVPLHYACAGGHEQVVSYLLKEGAEVQTLTAGGESCLHLAAKGGSETLVTLLGGKGLSVGLMTKANFSVADYAAMSGKLAVYKRFESQPKTSNHKRRSRLQMAASAAGGQELVQYFLTKEGGIQYKDRNGMGAIHFAAQSGDSVQVAGLLKAGGHLWQQDGLGRVPLHYAAMSGKVDTAKLLLEKKIWLEQKDRSGAIPLHYAARKGSVAMVTWLLEQGSKIDFPDYRKRTPLHYAADEGNTAVIALLLSRGAAIDPVDKRGRTPLMYAADERRDSAVTLLLSKGANIKKKDHLGRTPLHHLLGTPPTLSASAPGKTKERYAYTAPATVKNVSVASGSINLIPRLRLLRALETFTAKGADCNTADFSGNTPLATVFATGLKEAVELLIAKGADPKKTSAKTGLSPLHYAVYSGNPALVTMLLDKIKDGLEATTKDGRTLLHIAAMADSEAVMTMLIKKGAKLEALDSEGNTPLLLAGPKTAALLIEKGASGSNANKQGATGLHRAVMTGSNLLVQKLAVSREVVNKADNDGVTPLHLAVWTANLDLIKLLVEKGANIAAKDKWGATPFLTLGDGKGSAKDIAAIFAYMVEKGQKCEETDKEGNTMAHSLAAARLSDSEAVKAAAKVCDLTVLNKKGDSPVHIAVQKKNTTFLKALLALVPPFDPNSAEAVERPKWLDTKNKAGMNALQLALKKGHAPSLVLLHKAGADCDAMSLDDGTACVHVFAAAGTLSIFDKGKHGAGGLNNFTGTTGDGRNAYHFAAEKNRDTFMATLVANVPPAVLSFDAPDTKGRTPVFYAVKHARLAALQWFFTKKVDATRKDNDGNTLMHYAAMSQKAFIIKFLKSRKVAVDIKNKAGKLPADLVKARHLKKLLKP